MDLKNTNTQMEELRSDTNSHEKSIHHTHGELGVKLDGHVETG